MKTKQTPMRCLCCKSAVKGRSDKKFCNAYCRNEYNNSLRTDVNNSVRNINNALGKNRRILESFIKERKSARAAKDKLTERGFLFKYITHTCVNKKGERYFFCYDVGYLAVENDWFLIVKRNN